LARFTGKVQESSSASYIAGLQEPHGNEFSCEYKQLLLIDASVRAEAPLTVLPSQTVLVKVHINVRRCGAQELGVIYTLAVSTADDRTFIRLRFITA
jgi:hypothetical protein